MDSAMRDLEQIREREDAGEGRPLALVGLLIGVTIALVFAMGSLVGWTEESAELDDDPLARLDVRAGLTPADPTPDEEVEVPPVDRTALTFPRALAPLDEPPEVASVLAAAAAELEHPDPLDHLPPMPGAAAVARTVTEERVARVLPASVAAGTGSAALARTALSDPLVASSLPSPEASAPVAAGHDGEYTIQVISFPEEASADAFAAGLRSRGHHAFVVSAEIEDRGTWYRVRIGPFESQREAQAFRRSFEQSEGMNTLLVRRRD